MSKSERLKSLLGRGYFPEELPPPFTTVDFAKFRSSIGAAWTANANQYPKSVAERYSVPRPAKAKIIIPTPALAEVLVRAQEGAPERLRILKSSKHFKIVPFDERAAVEHAAVQTMRHTTGTKSPASPKAKAKFDDQIVAIAAVEGVAEIYSDDGDIAKLTGSRMKVIGVSDLPLPPEDAQADIFSLLPSDPTEDDDREPE